MSHYESSKKKKSPQHVLGNMYVCVCVQGYKGCSLINESLLIITFLNKLILKSSYHLFIYFLFKKCMKMKFAAKYKCITVCTASVPSKVFELGPILQNLTIY